LEVDGARAGDVNRRQWRIASDGLVVQQTGDRAYRPPGWGRRSAGLPQVIELACMHTYRR